ncbi:P-loop containing nucleoside triphosphate hydrolase [Glarea lozoyensis ATCC 20868]|uniref:p-loop containing nucleoside triphosphate hydrolase n=2 Tax=Glarea lozoyensis TaxID=101852 RepID=S3DVE2_GLAL2|nr:P-loop containing nucleoside triphosphate hydrolase [Glarea lozoyensis ATCC 20868]EPE30348.1 P-loop containing nucleoside triphosphate hydrolase [Glarea lozoyensis ATCC 20868]
MYLLFCLYALASLVSYAIADCASYGIDFIDGGSYFIDNTLSKPFTFLSDFEGCDSKTITPILVGPDEESYFCTDIPTSPDNTSFQSSCPIQQTAFTSGQWLIVIEGSTFAFVRTFTITAGTPVYTTVTGTATVGITSTPDAATSTTTSTSIGSTVLQPSTTVIPCKTLVLTNYEFPPPVTTYTTLNLGITINTGIVRKTGTTTSTITAKCTPNPFPRRQDPRMQKALLLPQTTISPTNKNSRRADAHHLGARDFAKRVAYNMALTRRGPDSPTSTVTITPASGPTVTLTTIAPTPTFTQTSISTTIVTSTPPAVTSCKGLQMSTTTSTFPTFTFTRLRITVPIVFTAKTISVVKTTKTTYTDAAVSTACINSGARSRIPDDPSKSANEGVENPAPENESTGLDDSKVGEDGTKSDTPKALDDTEDTSTILSRAKSGRVGNGRVTRLRPRQPEGLPAVVFPEWFWKNNVKRKDDPPRRGSLAVYATDNTSAEDQLESDTAIVDKLDVGRMEEAVAKCGLPSADEARYTMQVDVYTEIFSTIKSGLSLRPPKNSDSPSLNRPVIHLQCPQDGGSFYLDSAVETIASKLQADLISLDAHDISQIVAAYTEESAAWTQSNTTTLSYDTQSEAGNIEAWAMEPQEGLADGEDDFAGLQSRIQAMLKPKGNKKTPKFNPFGLSEAQTLVLTGVPDSSSNGITVVNDTDQWNSLKLSAIFNALVNAAEYKPVALQKESTEESGLNANDKSRGTIILVRDFKSLQATTQGSELISRLRTAVHKRWKEGENIVIVGTTSTEHGEAALSKPDIQKLQSDILGGEMRSIFVPSQRIERQEVAFESDEKTRFRMINIRHLEQMLESLTEGTEEVSPAIELEKNLDTSIITSTGLEDAVWTYARVHRVATTVLGLEDSSIKIVDGVLLGKALTILASSDEVKFDWGAAELREEEAEAQSMVDFEGSTVKKNEMTKEKLKAIRKSCKQHEKKLLSGVVIPSEIRTTFNDIRAPKETVEALKTLTSLSLIRPEAFSYGVLATDKIPGLLLYGPPGTGKTLLARAVAKESGATMLQISGADVNDMFVGEGEKNVKAVFSLAKKLSPCVVFIDEGDSIFSSRGDSKTRAASHRELINQFLREWDGMNDLSAFIMVATNRPFDLDEAVLRRLPRRLLVDLPVEKDREAILKIHLKDEILDQSVSLEKLAKDTPFYSGSDLKNVSVAAAMACIREENEIAAKHTGEEPHVFPEKRILTSKHFDKAMEEISASISEDMSTLSAIRKFDEKYGDRKGRRKKASALGFGGTTVVEKDSEAARVRKIEAS